MELITLSRIISGKIVINRFCPTLNVWTKIDKFLDRDVTQDFAVTFFNNELVLMGGWSPKTQKLASNVVVSINVKNMDRKVLKPTLLYRHSACAAVVDGRLYYLGGVDLYGNLLDEVECWDPKIGRWDFVAPMISLKVKFAVTVLNGRLYVAGGSSMTSTTDTMEYYDTKTNAWNICAPMICSRSSLGLAVFNNFIYAVGGHGSICKVGVVERYNPNTNTWMQLWNLNIHRSHLAVLEVSGHLLAIGGCMDGLNNSNAVEKYDPVTNTWSMMSPMNMHGECYGVMMKKNRET